MTKARQNSINRIISAHAAICELAVQEQKRSSQARKKHMENAYSTLTTHAHKLGLTVYQVGTYYSPTEYLKHADTIIERLNDMVKEEEKQK